MDHIIPARRPDLELINKKKKRICCVLDFTVPVVHRVKIKESEKIKKHGPCPKTSKTVEHESDGEINCSWCSWNSPQGLEEETRGIGNQWKNRDYYS